MRSDIKEIVELTPETAVWYGRLEAKFLVRFNQIAAWTKDASIVNGKYSDNKSTGFIMGNGNLGTNSALYISVTHLV